MLLLVLIIIVESIRMILIRTWKFIWSRLNTVAVNMVWTFKASARVQRIAALKSITVTVGKIFTVSKLIVLVKDEYYGYDKYDYNCDKHYHWDHHVVVLIRADCHNTSFRVIICISHIDSIVIISNDILVNLIYPRVRDDILLINLSLWSTSPGFYHNFVQFLVIRVQMIGCANPTWCCCRLCDWLLSCAQQLFVDSSRLNCGWFQQI